MKEKFNYRILDDSEATIIEFYITQSKDGFIFGIKRLKTDVHLTVLPNRGKLRVHITDTSELSDIDKVIWDQGTTFSVIEKKVLRLVKHTFRTPFYKNGFFLKSLRSTMISKNRYFTRLDSKNLDNF